MTRLDPGRAPWMQAPATRRVMAALSQARFVGGAVRNALLGAPVDEVDIATPLTPDAATAALEAAGIKVVPTGIAHGTVTAIAEGTPFEVTSLRRDVATDGRRATVAFTADWKEDAGRRDFTMNALYAAPDGEVFDYFGGIADLQAGRVRFVGDPATRIREDYLRILRLFRFHAWYGKGGIDAEALEAAMALKAGLARLSGERIAKEMLKLLAAADPVPALRAMTPDILDEILPDADSPARLEGLVRIDADHFFAPDAVLRLASLLPDRVCAAQAVAARWKLSNADRDRLIDLAGAREKIVSYLSIREVRALLYRLGPAPFKDRVRLRWAADAKETNATRWRALLALADTWQRPHFPLTGREAMLAGVPEGPLVGRVLAEVEEWWIGADFPDDPFALAERLKAVVQATVY